jgi:hypothetical protein
MKLEFQNLKIILQNFNLTEDPWILISRFGMSLSDRNLGFLEIKDADFD